MTTPAPHNESPGTTYSPASSPPPTGTAPASPQRPQKMACAGLRWCSETWPQGMTPDIERVGRHEMHLSCYRTRVTSLHPFVGLDFQDSCRDSRTFANLFHELLPGKTRIHEGCGACKGVIRSKGIDALQSAPDATQPSPNRRIWVLAPGIATARMECGNQPDSRFFSPASQPGRDSPSWC